MHSTSPLSCRYAMMLSVVSLFASACFKQEHVHASSDFDSVEVKSVGPSMDTVGKKELLTLLSIPQDSLLKVVYGDDVGEVKSIDRSIHTLAASDGTCNDGGLIIINRLPDNGSEYIDLVWITYDDTIAEWAASVPQDFEVAFQTSKTIRLVDKYRLSKTCNVMQVEEHINYGESVGSETIIHFYVVTDSSINGILSIVEREQREGDDGDSTDTSVTLHEEIEVLTTCVNGFFDLKVKQEGEARGEIQTDEKLFRFNLKSLQYEEVGK